MIKMDVGFYRYSLLNRGGDRLIVAYANHLAQSGHHVTIHVRCLNTVFTMDPLLTIRKIPYPGKAGTLLYAALHNLKHDIAVVDIIHLPLLLSLRNRVVYYAQADDREYYDRPLARKAIEVLYGIHFLSGRPIISMSQHLTSLFKQRVNLSAVYTINTGIDHDVFYPEPDDDLLKQKMGRKAVVFMARGDSYRKGYDIAMKVFGSLESDVADRMELWVCGNALNHTRCAFPVRNFGSVSDSRLRQILSSADVFFYPSRHEGFGLFPLEAMACGCVVVTTSAIPYARTSKSIVMSGIGDVVGLSDKLTRLIKDDALLNQYRASAVEEAGQYNLDRSKFEFEAALSNILMTPG